MSQVTGIIYLYVLSKVFFTERVKILIEEDTVLKNGLCDKNRKDSNLHDFFKGPKKSLPGVKLIFNWQYNKL